VIEGRRSGNYGNCGSRLCGRGFALQSCKVSREEYLVVWGSG
jgi:hypothetical protein